MSNWMLSQWFNRSAKAYSGSFDFQLQNLESRELYSASDLVINEFLASNTSGQTDIDGDRPDWIEIHNPTGSAIDLDGLFLTDDASDLTKWQLPAQSIGGNQYLVVFASGKDRATADDDIHTNFKLSKSGEYLGLIDTDGTTVIHDYGTQYPEQFDDTTYGLSSPSTVSYFTTPTPGGSNSGILLQSGPAIHNVTKNMEAVDNNVDIIVVATVTPVFDSVSSVALHYRVNYGSEFAVIMYDNGTNNDAIAGDGIYTGTISKNVSNVGDMVRWYVTAEDSDGRASRAPVWDANLIDRLNAPEYFGTMIKDPAVDSQLQTLEWFVNDPSAARTDAGTRASVYYNGEFYDNIFVRRRGQSSAGWYKRNYKFDFNKGHHFKHTEGEGRAEEFNLQSSYSDKSYIRRILSWDLFKNAREVGGLAFPMRVQQNGEFFSVATFVEQPDEDYLERNGLDPDGALYKMFNQLTSGFSGVEKKTRQYEGNDDLQALVDGVSPNASVSDRHTYLFDNVDLESVINHWAVQTLVHNNDQVAKNYYLYRDTNGTGKWRFVPWDMDLTWGRNFGAGGGVLSDGIWADDDRMSHPFFGDAEHGKIDNLWNRLTNAIMKDDTAREMYLRRLRTLMDQELQQEAKTAQPGITLTVDPATGQIAIQNYSLETVHLEAYTIGSAFGNFNPSTWNSLSDQGLAGWDEANPTNSIISELNLLNKLTLAPGQVYHLGVALNTVVTGELTLNYLLDDSKIIKEGEVIYGNLPVNEPGDWVANHAHEFDPQSGGDNLKLELRIDELYNLMKDDVALDRIKWGNPYGQNQDFLTAINILKEEYISVRREHLFENHSINNPAYPDNAGIPDEQSAGATVSFGNIDFRPASGNQDQEYIQINNSNGTAIDISGWTIEGGISHTFKSGTVIPAGGTLYLTKNFQAFLARTTGPAGGQGLLVQEGYQGHLSNFGEELVLKNNTGAQIATITTPADPTLAQEHLRISEINYNPYQVVPGTGETVSADNDSYEFIELINTSDSVTLDLAGVRLSGDVDFVFPSSANTLFGTQFESGLDGFTYVSNPFAAETSNNAASDSGAYDGSNGINNSGALKVRLEGRASGSASVYDPSGGFSRNFTLDSASTISISLDLRLILDGRMESHEFGRIYLEVDGVKYGFNGSDSLVQINGDGNFPDTPNDSGWLNREVSLNLGAGQHTVTIGSYYNQSDSSRLEGVTAYFDNFNIVAGDVNSGGYQLAPGERVVVVANQELFKQRYGNDVEIAGQYTKQLSNSGAKIKLDDVENSTIAEYDFPASGLSDGRGLTILPQNNALDNTVDGYIVADVYGGTPGEAEPTNTITPGDVTINEVLAHTDLPQEDLIELKNNTNQPIDLSGFLVSDSSNAFSFMIPSGTIIAANGYLTLTETQFSQLSDPGNIHAESFRLSSAHGETLTLFTAGNATGVSGRPTIVDAVSFGASFNGQTLGIVDGDTTGERKFYPLAQDTISTPGANSGQLVSPVVISEVHYNPTADLDDEKLEFVELYNHTDSPVDISGWRLDNAIDFLFPAGTILQAKQALIVVKFAQDNVDALAAFNAAYNVESGALFLFDYSGKLNNGGDRLQLERPDSPPLEEPDFTPWVSADEVNYAAATPWPAAANGLGESLNRTAADAFGNNAASWNAASPTPGSADITIGVLPGDLDGDGDVDNDDLVIVKQGFGSTFTLSDLFSVRNNFTPPASAAAIVPNAMVTEEVVPVDGEENMPSVKEASVIEALDPQTEAASESSDFPIIEGIEYQLFTIDTQVTVNQIEADDRNEATQRTISQGDSFDLLNVDDEDSDWLF